MSERIDIDSLARECGAHAVNIADREEEDPQCVFDYQFFPSELTAYTRAVMEECAKACETRFPKIHTWASENSDRYHIQDETVLECAAAIREMMP